MLGEQSFEDLSMLTGHLGHHVRLRSGMIENRCVVGGRVSPKEALDVAIARPLY